MMEATVFFMLLSAYQELAVHLNKPSAHLGVAAHWLRNTAAGSRHRYSTVNENPRPPPLSDSLLVQNLSVHYSLSVQCTDNETLVYVLTLTVVPIN
jgi:hypothetical protein